MEILNDRKLSKFLENIAIAYSDGRMRNPETKVRLVKFSKDFIDWVIFIAKPKVIEGDDVEIIKPIPTRVKLFRNLAFSDGIGRIEDVRQECLLEIMDSLDEYDPFKERYSKFLLKAMYRATSRMMRKINKIKKHEYKLGHTKLKEMTDDTDPVWQECKRRNCLDLIDKILSTFKNPERICVLLRFGLFEDSLPPMTLAEIGKFLPVVSSAPEISRERVRQILFKAILRLQHKSRAEVLADFM